jgi:hypothetical protein
MPTFFRAGTYLINLANVTHISHVPAKNPGYVSKDEHLVLYFTSGETLMIGDPDALQALLTALGANNSAT